MPTQRVIVGKNKNCKVELSIVTEREQGYIKITLSFKRERKEGENHLSFKTATQKMSYQWYANAFDSPDDLSIKHITNEVAGKDEKDGVLSNELEAMLRTKKNINRN